MADGIYVGMAGAAARAAQLESVADNLANAETPGFKAGRPAFASFLPAGGRTDKVFSAAVATGTDLRPGMVVPTDNPLDVVPEGDLFLGVQTPRGPAYTRNGQIQVGADGQLTVSGYPLLGKGGQTITVPEGTAPTLTEDGDVVIDGSVVDSIGLFKIQGPVDRNGLALFTPGAGAQVTEADAGTVRVGELEMGNAPALESTIAMITAQRHFETAMQAIQTYRKLDERAIEVGKVR